MVKYFKELENRDKYFLPLIDEFSSDDKSFYDFKLPLTFYYENKNLFSLADKLIDDYKKIECNDLLVQCKLGTIGYDECFSMIEEYDRLREDCYVVDEFKRLDFSARDTYYYFKYIGDISYLLENVYKDKSNIYQKSTELFSKGYKEIDNYGSMKLNSNKTKNVYLPDCFYITDSNCLYNSTGDLGHKQSNLIYPYGTVKEFIRRDIPIDELYENSVKTRKKIEKNGYIDRAMFKEYLNYMYTFPSINNSFYNGVCHETRIVNTIKGIVAAQESFYRYFLDMQKYTNKESIDKLGELTNNVISDILVRCCLFHKIDTALTKTITTSDVNYKENLDEYIKKGWDVYFIPPIIIEREKKTVNSLNMESCFVKKYIKNKI